MFPCRDQPSAFRPDICVPSMPRAYRSHWQNIYTAWSLLYLYIAFLWFQWKHTNVPMPRPAKCTLTRMCVPRMPSESRSYWQHIYTTWSLFSLHPSWDFNGNIPMFRCRDRPIALQPECVFRECGVNPRFTDNTFVLPDPFVTYISFLWFQWKYANVSMLRQAKCTPTRMCVLRMPRGCQSYWQYIYTAWSLFTL